MKNVSNPARFRMNELVLKMINNAGEDGIKQTEIATTLKQHSSTVYSAWQKYRCEDLIREGKAVIFMRGKTKLVRKTQHIASPITNQIFPFTPLKEAFKGPKIIRRT